MSFNILSYFKDSTNEKIRNPFIFTYIFLWILRKWKLFLTISYFDEDCTMDDKLSTIDAYFNSINFYDDILENLFWTFVVLTSTYLLKNIAEYIQRISNDIVRPLIIRHSSGKASIVPYSDKFELIKKLDGLTKSYEDEINRNITVKNELDTLKLKLSGLKKTHANELEVFNSQLNESNLKFKNQELHSKTVEKEKKSAEEMNELYKNEVNKLKIELKEIEKLQTDLKRESFENSLLKSKMDYVRYNYGEINYKDRSNKEISKGVIDVIDRELVVEHKKDIVMELLSEVITGNNRVDNLGRKYNDAIRKAKVLKLIHEVNQENLFSPFIFPTNRGNAYYNKFRDEHIAPSSVDE